MKILIYAKNIDGGTGTFVQTLGQLKSFRKRKFNIQVIVTHQSKHRFKQNIYCFPSSLAGEEVDKYNISLKQFLSLAKELIWLYRHIRIFQPDTIITVDSHCLLLASLVKRRKDIIIATVHNNLREVIKHKIPQMLRSQLQRWLGVFLRRSSVVVCTSKLLALDLKKSFRLSKLPVTIYYGIDCLKGNSLQRIQKQKACLLSIGRFCDQKDFVTVIEAFSVVKKNITNLELNLVGDGPKRKEYEKLVEQKGQSDIHILGWKNDLHQIYQSADILVFASNWEGFGYVILEAMSQGLPVIATDTPFGPSEILQKGKYGILVPQKDPVKMAIAISKLLSSSELRYKYSLLSRKRARFFSKEKMLSAYQDLLLSFVY